MDVEKMNKLLQESPVQPNLTTLFRFEKQQYEDLPLGQPHQYYIAYIIAAVYVIVIFSIKSYMKNREPFELRRLLIAWNICLALSAGLGFTRTLPELLHVLRTQGFAYSVCVPSFINWEVSLVWCWIFIMLKIPEMGDTLFIVLGKKRLIFLHWYHHATVLLFAFHGYHNHMGGARYFVVMNYFAHSFVYTYYTLHALNIRIPLLLKMSLTVAQIVQFFVGGYVIYYAYYLKSKGVTACSFTDRSIYFGFFIYVTYTILFINFFYHTYLYERSKLKENKSLKKE